MNDFETTKQVSPLTNSELEREALDFALKAANLVDSLLEQNGYKPDSSVRHNLGHVIAFLNDSSRATLSTEAQSEVTRAVAWRWGNEYGWLLTDEKLVSNNPSIHVEPLYPPSAIEGYAQELAKRLVREKLEEVVSMIEHTPSLKDPDDTVRLIQNKVRALINT